MRPEGKLRCAVALALALLAPGVRAADAALRPELAAFIGEMVARHGFERAGLEGLLAGARPQAGVLRAIAAPVTAKPWHEFRVLYVTPERIAGGVRFAEANAVALARASRDYGVPEEIIAAVIGVETSYGQRLGSHRVLDALVTLAFDYAPRAPFFRGELEQFLLFTRDGGGDPARLRGSYAGAMGIPQFMPSSARHYAVDHDGDRRTDLWNEADAIGSVANFLKVHGWRAGEDIAARARLEGAEPAELLQDGVKPARSVAELRRHGVAPAAGTAEVRAAALLKLEAAQGAEYWLGFQNFYAITRYNRSVNYAMAVMQLAEEIRARRR